jgi:hypothetical protein
MILLIGAAMFVDRLEPWSRVAAQSAPTTVQVTVTPLDLLTGCSGSTVVRAINASGVAVGHAEGCYPNFAEPFYPDFLAVRFNPTSLVHLVHDVIFSPFQVIAYEVATEALSINDSGAIAGDGAFAPSTFGLYAFPGGWLPPLPNAVNQFGGYINNAGEVVGTTFFDSLNRTPGHATLWVAGAPTDLGTFNGIGITPAALAPNLSGANRIIVGSYYPSPNGNFATAVMWRNGSWSELPGPPGCNINSTIANDVADDGVVAGSEGFCGHGGVLWENGQMRSLGPECQLTGVPGAGPLLGITVTPGGRHIAVGTCGGSRPAVFYDDSRGNYSAALLPLLAGHTSGGAVDVNASGQIVGYSRIGNGPLRAVRWDVILPNNAPAAEDGTLATAEDTAASGLLVADDAEDVNVSYRIVSQGTKGTAVVTNAATGAFTYTPNPNANGPDSFTFAASDGSLESLPASVNVDIIPVNDPPVAQDGAAATNAGTSVAGTLVASDIDSAALIYAVGINGSKGTAVVTDAATGAYTYTANAGTSGLDTFNFMASDGVLTSNEATVTITISNPCALDVSGAVAVTRSGYVYNPGTRRFYQTIRITNTSGAAISGPFALVLDSLSSNATLFNAAGATSCAGLAGSPYADNASALLAPGSNVTLVLQFTNPSRTAITYATRVLAGSGAR